MRYTMIVCLLVAGCSSPTAPSPVPTPVAVVTPPVVVTPPPVATADPILSDPRYSASFYRVFALGGGYPLRRQTQPPRIYLRTVDDAGAPIDAGTLNATAAALINTAGKLTGVFGLAGLEQGTGAREGQDGWITVRWAAVMDGDVCGRANAIAGNLITLYPKHSGCRCPGGPAVTLATVKHELGHVLGFHHTDDPTELMYHTVGNICDRDPTPREVFHSAVAYSRPVGSLAP